MTMKTSRRPITRGTIAGIKRTFKANKVTIKNTGKKAKKANARTDNKKVRELVKRHGNNIERLGKSLTNYGERTAKRNTRLDASITRQLAKQDKREARVLNKVESILQLLSK